MSDRANHMEDKISPYLDEELDETQRKAFEEHLAACESCKASFETHRNIHAILQGSQQPGRNHLSTHELISYQQGEIREPESLNRVQSHLLACATCRELLDAAKAVNETDPEAIRKEVWDSEQRTQPVQWKAFLDNVRSALTVHRVLIGIALASVVIFLIIWIYPAPNPYAALAVINPSEFVATEIRGQSGEEIHDQFLEGMELYQQEDYAAAIPVLQKAADAVPDNPQYQFYCGEAMLLNYQYMDGLAYLEKEVVLNSVYREEALWDAAIGYLKLNNPQKAKMLFNELIAEETQYAERARTIINQIEAI